MKAKPLCLKSMAILSFALYIPALSGEEGDSAESLMKILSTGSHEAQSTASRRLGDLKEERSIPALIGLLESSEDAEVRRNAAIALSAIGKSGLATDALLVAIRRDASDTVRYTALVGLSRLYDTAKKELIIKECLNLENSGDPFIKDIAARVRILYAK